MIIKCIYWLYLFPVLFGDSSVVYLKPYAEGSFRDLAFLLTNHDSPAINLAFIVMALLICLFTLTKKNTTYIAEFILWLLVLNIHNRVYPTLTGGDHLLNQFLLFNIFIGARESSGGKTDEVRVMLHQFGVFAIVTQVCIVYFLAAVAKLTDPLWMQGEAARMIAGVDHFSNGSRFGWPAPVYTLLNYFVVFYQLLFPALVWLRRTKLIFLLAGILMHVYIAFVTGLPGFAAVMLIGYIYFWPDRQPHVKK